MHAHLGIAHWLQIKSFSLWLFNVISYNGVFVHFVQLLISRSLVVPIIFTSVTVFTDGEESSNEGTLFQKWNLICKTKGLDAKH